MSYFESKFNIDDFIKAYEGYYENHPFVHISKDELSLKEVVNTNKCVIHIKQIDKKILITSIIDNLIKGASGQAIQNMNLMYGLDEKLGLKLKSTTF
jgi:N-acetyl-gamma-glutamyl-phosphate reductase